MFTKAGFKGNSFDASRAAFEISFCTSDVRFVTFTHEEYYLLTNKYIWKTRLGSPSRGLPAGTLAWGMPPI